MPAKKPVAAAADADDLELYEQLKELGGGATIQVYREPNREFLDTVQPDSVELENLKEMFGGGSYSLRARRDGTWIKGISMVRVRIAGAPKPGSPGQPLTPDPAPAPVPAGAPYRPMATTVEGRLAELELALTRNAQPSGDSAALTMMTTLLVPVLTAALTRQPENTAGEIFELARKFAKDQRDAAGAYQPPESDPVRDLGIPLLDVIARGLPTAKPPSAALPPGDPPAPEVQELAADTKELPTEAGEPPTMEQLAVRIAGWCEPLERRDADPGMRAWCFLEDMQDSPLLDSCVSLIRLPDVLDRWAKIAPRVGERREWYAAFVDELRRLTDDPDAEDPERDPRDPVHATANGEAGVEREPNAGDPGAGA